MFAENEWGATEKGGELEHLSRFFAGSIKVKMREKVEKTLVLLLLAIFSTKI